MKRGYKDILRDIMLKLATEIIEAKDLIKINKQEIKKDNYRRFRKEKTRDIQY